MKKDVLKQVFANLAKVKADKSMMSNYALLTPDSIAVANDGEFMRFDGLNIDFSNNSEQTIYVEFKKLSDIVKKAKCSDFVFVVEDGRLTINGKFSLGGYMSDESRCSQIVGDMVCDVVISSDVRTAVARASNFIASDKLRPIMNGVLLRGGDVVATDAHKLYANSVEGLSVEGDGVVLPLHLLKIFNLFSDMSIFGGGWLRLSGGGYTYETKAIEGIFPNYKAVIPTGYTESVTVNKSELVDTLNEAQIMANETTQLSRWSIYKEGVNIKCVDIDFDRTYNSNIGNCGGDIAVEVGLKIGFVLDIMKQYDNDEVYMEYKDSTRAVMYRTDREVFLQMPMMLN